MNDEGRHCGPVASSAGASEWHNWLASPPGRYVLAWQQAHFDAAVSDLFGFHALQLGAPGVDALRDNRMPHRMHACRLEDLAEGFVPELLVEHFEELPIATESLDLVVLPHVLEFAADPHQVLREVDRVLRPEGRVIVSGFNPVSLWGMRQWWTRSIAADAFVPRDGQFIALPRLRDWFKLLSFEFHRGRYGCYRPPCRTQKWLDRTRFMEDAGDRWWPICGALYVVSAIKRVRAMRLVGPVRRTSLVKRAAPAAIAASRGVARLPARRETTDQRYM
ncbi:MAG: methyltransferase domain-containing protein [Burkholderiaceae bacterium]|nr:methyltransferase domain-containing protein [Burkholderiaceae bacterium]